MKIGIIGAMEMEVELIKNKLENIKTTEISGVTFFEGSINGVHTIAAKSGEGKVNAAICTQTMILTFKPDFILNTGVAGAVGDGLDIMDVVIAESVVQHDSDFTPLGKAPGYLEVVNTVEIKCNEKMASILADVCKKHNLNTKTGIVATGDQFIADNAKKEYLKNTFNALCAEMEGGSIGHVCMRNNIDFCVLRAISDSADNDSSMDFPKFAKLASEKSSAVTIDFISSLKG